MIPIKDVNPTRSRPVITWLIVLGAAYVFFAVQPLGPVDGTRFLYQTATIPCEIATAEPLSSAEIQTGRCVSGDGDPVFSDKGILISLVASIFLHGGLGHLIGNLWILWIFGNNVEDAMGKLRFIAFYLGAGLVASLAHVVMNPSSTIPVVGASGAIAGVMGAYLVLFPHARIVSLIPPLFFLPFEVPALIYLVLWFFGQFALAGAETNIAWEAHVAGFVVGLGYAAFRRRQLLRRLAYPRH